LLFLPEFLGNFGILYARKLKTKRKKKTPMGYSTDFDGEFNITPKLSSDDKTFLNNLANTRRMARNVGAEYGSEGEFYVDGSGDFGQEKDDNIIDFNRPPNTQPGLWCQWNPNDTGDTLMWNGGEKFYNYKEWLQYLIDKILAPRGYTLNGEVFWNGEDSDDFGKIVVLNNVMTAKEGRRVYD